jgi:hypothetical protein
MQVFADLVHGLDKTSERTEDFCPNLPAVTILILQAFEAPGYVTMMHTPLTCPP